MANVAELQDFAITISATFELNGKYDIAVAVRSKLKTQKMQAER